ncbi:MAG: LacI family DNA-binding transcriptional regulator [Tepidisphaeraceae bacterium]|jgi:DNA-binding LacI/PurR family transcriptional regulator
MNKLRFQVSQKRIAEQAGVSQSTVSLVLSGRRGNSDQTSQRVLQAAERLKYRPNLLVQGIQTGKTRMIGVMMPPFDYFWSEVLYGIHDTLTNADHVPITLWTVHTGPSPRRRNGPAGSGNELDQIHRLVDRRVDGVILWPSFAQLFVEHIHEFSSRNLPVVTIDHQLPPEFNSDYVGSDEAMGGRMVAEHLYALGHRRFGHLAGPAVATWALARREAFESALSRMPGVSFATREAPAGEVDLGIIPARELLSLPDRPTAIFAASDLYAKTVYKAAKEFNLKIPDDLSVVGFADDDFACEMSPPLTTVRQPAYEIGQRAAQVVLGRSLGQIRDRGRHEELPVKLIARESSQEYRDMAARN